MSLLDRFLGYGNKGNVVEEEIDDMYNVVGKKPKEEQQSNNNEGSKVQTVYTTPPPQPEDKGESNLEYEEVVDNSGAAQKKATPPRDNTESVFRTGNEVGFYKGLDKEDGAGATASNAKDNTVGKTEDGKPDTNENANNGKADVDYPEMRAYMAWLKSMGDKEAKSELSDEEKKKIEKAYKHKMLLAGIADAGNAFHQAYAYARGIKPMNGTDKSYSKEAKKEIRDDWEWMNKKNDRALDYYAKAAELERAIRTLDNADRLQKSKEKYYDYLNKNVEYKEWKAKIDDAFRNRKQDFAEFAKKEELRLKKDWQEHKISYDEYKQKMDWLKLFTEEDVDYIMNDYDEKVGEHRSKYVNVNAANGTQSSSAGSTSNSGKKSLPTAKKQLP